VTTLPFILCAWGSPSPHAIALKTAAITFGTFALLAIPSIIGATVLLALTPLQIIVPELTMFVLQLHKWSRPD